MREKILKIYGIAIICGVIYFALIYFKGSGLPCFYRNTLGFLCPGCGASDMFVALSELKIAQAFWCNPFVFVALILWTCVAIFYFVKNRMSQGDRHFVKILFIISIVAMIVFGVTRNIY